MRNKTSPSEYLALLSVKYEVDGDNLFHALVSAGENRRSQCGTLAVECRSKRKNTMIFLITKGTKVVAQFPLLRDFLLQKSNPIRDARTVNGLRKSLIKKDRQSKLLQIKDLQIGMKNVSLKAGVLEIATPTSVVTRFGNYANVANALVSDDTGTIRLCLWNEQITSVSVGDTVEIENASISTFRGEKQLRIGRKGVLRNARAVVSS